MSLGILNGLYIIFIGFIYIFIVLYFFLIGIVNKSIYTFSDITNLIQSGYFKKLFFIDISNFLQTDYFSFSEIMKLPNLSVKHYIIYIGVLIFIFGLLTILNGIYKIILGLYKRNIGSVKIGTDVVSYNYGDNVNYEVCITLKKELPEKRKLYLQLIGLKIIWNGDNTNYVPKILVSKVLDELGDDVGGVEKRYTGIIKIPDFEEIEEQKKPKNLDERNIIYKLFSPNGYHSKYKEFYLKVLFDDKNGGLFESDLEDIFYIYIKLKNN